MTFRPLQVPSLFSSLIALLIALLIASLIRLAAVEEALETTREAIMSNLREVKLEVDSVWATMKRGKHELGNLGEREKFLLGYFPLILSHYTSFLPFCSAPSWHAPPSPTYRVCRKGHEGMPHEKRANDRAEKGGERGERDLQ